MKTKILFSAAMGMLVALPALAQQAPARQVAQPMTLAALQARIQAQFARTDADRDGFITQAEAQAQAGVRKQRQLSAAKRAKRLARFDTDRDGTISQTERQAAVAARGGDQAKNAERRAARMERRRERQAMRAQRGMRVGEKRFAMLDANKDGRLSLAEVSARAATRFERIDANRDGAITREERRAIRAQRQARRNG